MNGGPIRLLGAAVLLVVTVARSAPSAETTARGNDDARRTAEVVAPGVDPEEGQEAVDVALRDERLQELLTAHPFRVAEVREPTGTGQRGLVVTVEFEQPLDDERYPLDVRAIDTDGLPITGVVWLIQGQQRAAVSPRWGDDIACGY